MSSVLVLTATSPSLKPRLLEEMYRQRYEVFKERLNWDIKCINGMDIDQFDVLDPIYAIYLNNDGLVEGSWRLLPTTGSYMIKDVFPELLEGEEPPAESAVWEVSRFSALARCVDEQSLAALRPITSALLISLVQVGLRMGLKRIVSASDILFERILKRSGAIAHRLGGVHRIGNTRAVAGWIDINQEHLNTLKSVAPPNDRADTFFADSFLTTEESANSVQNHQPAVPDLTMPARILHATE